MRIELPFTNQIVGVASGFKSVSLNNVQDREFFDIPEGEPADFPVSVTIPNQTHTAPLRYHDGSHWLTLSPSSWSKGRGDSIARMRFESYFEDILQAGLHTPATGDAFLYGQKFSHVLEDFRPAIIDRISAMIDQEFVILEGELLRRCPEPAYEMVFDPKDPYYVSMFCNGYDVKRPANLGNRVFFRCDDLDGAGEFLLDLQDRGFEMPATMRYGIWPFKPYQVLMPQSVTLDATKLTCVELLRAITSSVKRSTLAPRMLERWADLTDRLERDEPDEDWGELLSLAAPLAGHPHSALSVTLAAAERLWDARPIDAPLADPRHDNMMPRR